jgi:hypothetical protein
VGKVFIPVLEIEIGSSGLSAQLAAPTVRRR